MFRDLLLKPVKKNERSIPSATPKTEFVSQGTPEKQDDIKEETKISLTPPLDHLAVVAQKKKDIYSNKVTLSARYKTKAEKVFVCLHANESRLRRRGERIFFPVDFDAELDEKQISLTGPVREYLNYELNKEIPDVKLISIEKSAMPISAYHLEIELQKVHPSGIISEVIDLEEFAVAVKSFFKNYPLVTNQVLLMPHPSKEKTTYELIIRSINCSTEVANRDTGAPLDYTLAENCKIVLNLSAFAENRQDIRISNARKLNLDFVKQGIGGHKDELAQLVRSAFYTRAFDSEVVKAYGIQHTKGILLYGPPGTGKTLIAKQISKIFSDEAKGESRDKVPKVYVINGPELKNKMVGQSVENLRKIFAPAIAEWNAKKEKSDVHIIIIDELDALAPPRGSRAGSVGVDDDMVTTLLTLVDGVDSPGNILIIGTTNRIELIDEAVLRPGRISVHIKIGLPDQEGRLEILNIHTHSQRENNMLDIDVDLAYWAEKTENYTGAEIKDLVDRATQYAMSGNFDPAADCLEVKKELRRIDQFAKVKHEHFEKAFEEIAPKFGISKKNFNFNQDKFIIYSDEVSEIKAKYEESLAALKAKDGLNGFCFLISGENGAGKTELAKYLASISDAKFIKIITADDLLSLPVGQRIDKLDKEFKDAQLSESSVIILDGIENLLEADYDLSRPVNQLRIKFQSLLKDIDKHDNKCIVIATTTSEQFVNKIFPGLFNDAYTLSNVVIRYANTDDISKLSEIVKTLNLSLIPPKITPEDKRVIDMSISKLIFEIKRFCLGRGKTNQLNLDEFYQFLNEKQIPRLADFKKSDQAKFSRSISLFTTDARPAAASAVVAPIRSLHV